MATHCQATLAGFPRIGGMISLKQPARYVRGIVAQASGYLPGTSAHFGVPRRFETSTYRWFAGEDAVDTRRQTIFRGQNRYLHIEDESFCRREPPVYVDAILEEKTFASLDARRLPRFVASLRTGRVVGSCFGCVVTEDDTLLQDVSLNNAAWCKEVDRKSEHNAFKKFYPPVNLRVDGEAIALNSPFSANFHHFLLDTLPRLGLCEAAGFDLSSAKAVVTDYRHNRFQDEAFAKMGIDSGKVLRISPELHLEAKVLHVPSISEPHSREQYVEYSKVGMEFVRSRIRPAISSRKKKRLLLSRRLAQCRRWVEEDVALAELESLGFVRVECELLSLTEQARLFSQAEVVIMPHGGGMANCVFCEPGTKVFELFNPLYHPVFMLSLANVLGLKYYAVAGELCEGDDRHTDIGASVNVSIAPEKMIGLLKRYL
jgi:capsular polysaccharide biosynthesis protein